LIKISKVKLGIRSKSSKTLSTGGIQPLLIYGAPFWAETTEKSYKKKFTRVQRLINIKIAKA